MTNAVAKARVAIEALKTIDDRAQQDLFILLSRLDMILDAHDQLAAQGLNVDRSVAIIEKTLEEIENLGV